MTRRLLIAPLLVALLVGACGGESASPVGRRSHVRTPRGRTSRARATPTPSPVDAGAGRASGEFEPIVLKGKGDDDVDVRDPRGRDRLASMSHPGSGAPFQVAGVRRGRDRSTPSTLVRGQRQVRGRGVLFDLVDHSVGVRRSRPRAAGRSRVAAESDEPGGPGHGTGTLKGKGDAIGLLTPSAADCEARRRDPAARRVPRSARTRPTTRCYLVAGPDRQGDRLELPEDRGSRRDPREGQLDASTATSPGTVGRGEPA